MDAINYDTELRRAGAYSTHGWRKLTFLAQRYMLGTAGLIIMVMFVLAAALADVICRFSPLAVDSAHALAAPNSQHWMGTDSFGRDVWSRIIHGARISLAVGIGSTALGSSIGVIVGLASGYLSGWVDLVFQRITDILQALPLLVLALVVTAALGPSLPNVIIAIAIPLIPTVSRVIRANTLALRELPFVEAAKSIGMSEMRIALRHVLPNTLAPLIVLATAQLGSAILVEASLSFLGLGIPEPYPSWGRMLSESAAEYVRTAPWLVIFPGVAISLTVFGTNLLGDALRDSKHFEVVADGSAIPVVSFRLAGDFGYTEFDVSHALRGYGWQVPAYTMPEGATGITMLRMLVREGFSADLARVLRDDINTVMTHLDELKPGGYFDQVQPFAH